jgi:hypothetical protein
MHFRGMSTFNIAIYKMEQVRREIDIRLIAITLENKLDYPSASNCIRRTVLGGLENKYSDPE